MRMDRVGNGGTTLPGRDRAAQRDTLLALVAQARSLTPPDRPADLPMNQFPNVPDWHTHEHSIWALGEDARRALATSPSLRGDLEIYGRIAQLTANRAAGRGRQSWVMLFGYVACAPFAPAIAELLDDADVAGHAIQALTVTRVPDHVDRVRPLLNDGAAWIRRAARRYVDQHESAVPGEE
ncbi:hypothetical protein [Tsukamurella tyrosinosolvens]|uniref:hypothetical protein n=2 Tax=Tsukamurella tyrosinosolvens TaxID=57704 RepID=UPI0015F17DF3|nr:hypothetical protein [Tsukamurella tyrosinosolvens]